VPDDRRRDVAEHARALLVERGERIPHVVDVAPPVVLAADAVHLERRLGAAQQLDLLGEIARVAHSGRVRLALIEAQHEVVVAGDAMVTLLAQRRQLIGPLLDGGRRHRRRGWDAIEQVPVRGEGFGDRPQLIEPHARGEPEHDDGLRVGVVEQLVDEPIPPRVERDRRRDLVADLDARRQAGFDRELGEQALRERVQRGDRRRVERIQRGRARDITRAGRNLQFGPDPCPQFGRGLLGEGDRGDRPHRDASPYEPDDARHERRGFPGTRAGFDEQRAGEVGRDRGARGVVAGTEREQRGLDRVARFGHSMAPVSVA
jgi:hypothetical protein